LWWFWDRTTEALGSQPALNKQFDRPILEGRRKRSPSFFRSPQGHHTARRFLSLRREILGAKFLAQNFSVALLFDHVHLITSSAHAVQEAPPAFAEGRHCSLARRS